MSSWPLNKSVFGLCPIATKKPDAGMVIS